MVNNILERETNRMNGRQTDAVKPEPAESTP
jgi:hypothetical protein